MKVFGIFSVVVIATLLTGAYLVPVSAQADVFIVERMQAKYSLSKDQTLVVQENLWVDFSEQRHGIIRHIPAVYKRAWYQSDLELNPQIISVTDIAGAPVQYSSELSGGYLSLRIGDPSAFVFGAASYSISYTLSNVVQFFDEGPELYLDVNGTEWTVPFREIFAEIELPEGFLGDSNSCYTGPAGSQQQLCTIEASENRISLRTNEPLEAGESLTLALSLDQSQFPIPGFWQRYGDAILRNSGAVLPLIIFGWMYRRWLTTGRDAPLGVVVNEFSPPSNLRPAALGVIDDFYSNNYDIAATFIDLAQRGYLTIIDETKKESAKKRTLSFRLGKADFTDLEPYEAELMNGVFEEAEVGAIVELKTLKNKFLSTIQAAEVLLYKQLTKDGFFYENPEQVRNKYRAIGGTLFAAGFVAAIFLGLLPKAPGLFFGLISSGLMVMLFSSVMTKRTDKGHRAWQQAAGLKRYMNLAEKDRLAMLQSPGSQYFRKALDGRDGFSVELYEKLLPYAIVFQVEEAWTKQFEGIINSPPEWYQANSASFSSSVFASQLGSSVAQMRKTMTSSPRSSSSGGSRGGGVSGGGVGGGGGSSW